jgi:hypothetical protein
MHRVTIIASLMKHLRSTSTSCTNGTRSNAIVLFAALVLLASAPALPCTNQLVHIYFDGCQPSAASIGATIKPADGSKPIRVTISKGSQPYWRGTWATTLDPVKSGENARLEFKATDVRTACNITSEEEPDGNDCAVVYHVQCEPMWKLSVLSIEQAKVYDFLYKLEEVAPQESLHACDEGNEQSGKTDAIVAAGEGQNIYIKLDELPFRIIREKLLNRMPHSAPIYDFALPIVTSSYPNSTAALFDSTRAKDKQPKVRVALP